MINKLKLHNFKAYKDQEFVFSNLTVFCGTNSVGKSTAIQALSIPLQSYFDFSAALNGDLVELGYLDDVHHQNAEDASLEIALEVDSYVMSWGYRDIDQQEAESNKNLSTIVPPSDKSKAGLREIVDTIQFLQAERYGPRINYELATSGGFHKDWLGTKGEFTSEFLSRSGRSERLFVGAVNVSEDALLDPRLHPQEEQTSLVPQLDAWLKEISPGMSVTSKLFKEASTSVNVFEQNGNKALKPHNVGFGVSYALSIVTALLYTRKGGLVIIENPEAHLHPKGQSYLGRLIALTAQAGVQVIVETHSDHLLNGIRVVTRLEDGFDPKLFTLYYISQNEGESNAEKITITKDGKLSNWPDGFFDQQAQDMFMIMTGQDQLPSKRA
jgi:predicted ATPase